MDTIDASIPLQVQGLKLDNPLDVYGKAMSVKSLQANTQMKNLELMQGMQTLKDQQQLSAVGADPSNYDQTTGMFNDQGLAKIENPTLRQKLTQDRLKAQGERATIDHLTSDTKIKKEDHQGAVVHDIMEDAYSEYEANRDKPDLAMEKMRKKIKEGFDGLAATGKGDFSEKELDAIAGKWMSAKPEEILSTLTIRKEKLAAEEKKKADERAEKTPIVKDAETLEKWKTQLAGLPANDPGSRPLKEQIKMLESNIARRDRMPGGNGDGEGKAPAGYRWKPNGTQEKIPGGPADKDHRDAIQADALSAYHAEVSEYNAEVNSRLGLNPSIAKTMPPLKPPGDLDTYVENYKKKRGGGGEEKPAADAKPAKDAKAPAAPKVSDKAGFEKLKKGDHYIDARDGKEWIKG
jgi:hypothetical protein